MVTHPESNKWPTVPVVVYGPPGTGKTTWLLRDMGDRLRDGIRPERMGFVSFTKSAVGEASSRAESIVGGADLPYFRTLHSLGYQLLGRPPVVGAPDAKVMFETWGYEVKLGRDAGSSPDSMCIQQWTLLRLQSRSMDEAKGRLAGLRGPERLLIERYEQLRASEGRIDYTDMLMLGMGCELPALDVLYVDEAQDLCPLQIEFVERLAQKSTQVVIAGDDDQAIMRFQGAEPEWLQSLDEIGDVTVLPQSYRVPAAAHRVAEEVVSRISRRIPKVYLPRDEEGLVSFADSVEETIQEARGALRDGQTVAYLARTNAECSDAVEWSIAHRVPFVAHAGAGSRPLQAPKMLSACVAAIRVRTTGNCYGAELVDMLDQVHKPPHGTKAAAKRLNPESLVTTTEATMLGLGALWRTLKSSPGRFDALTLIPDQASKYLDAVLLEDGSVPAPVLEIGTQHWSKGQEWDVVIVDDMLPRPSIDALNGWGVDADDEHRIAYVAVTRARAWLVLLSKARRSKGAGAFAGRYPYPRDDD